jgi:flavin reductase (DIM6/NTAB) family NADH-FMN oxidoreductase RutF
MHVFGLLLLLFCVAMQGASLVAALSGPSCTWNVPGQALQHAWLLSAAINGQQPSWVRTELRLSQLWRTAANSWEQTLLAGGFVCSSSSSLPPGCQ